MSRPRAARARASEWDFVEALTRTLGGGPRSRRGVRLDVGDDAAVLAPVAGGAVLSVDASVEDVHFRRAWAPWDVIGARAFEAALSDLAAMGARPVAALLALALPKATTLAEVEGIASGVARAAERARCPVVGGNVTRASEVSLTTTVVGAATRAVLRRDGARGGDVVYVSGPLGGAALGLAVLQRGKPRSALEKRFVGRWQSPRARIAMGRALVGRASACIDLSDGLVSDLGHVARASAVAIELDARTIPIASGHAALATRLGLDPIALALGGGEDYELAFTMKRGVRAPRGAHAIGRIVRGAPEVRVVGHAAGRAGFDHFG